MIKIEFDGEKKESEKKSAENAFCWDHCVRLFDKSNMAWFLTTVLSETDGLWCWVILMESKHQFLFLGNRDFNFLLSFWSFDFYQ